VSTASTREGTAGEKISLKIARNTLANAVGRIWSMLVVFLLTPYIVGKLGDERFGIWAFLGVFLGYFAVVDLGIGPALIKYVSQFHTTGDFDRLNLTINSAFLGVSLVMATLCLIGVSSSGTLLHLLKIPAQNYPEAHFAFIGFFIIMLGQGSVGVFQGVLCGLQRMEVLNLVSISTSVPYVISIILFLGHGYGLPGLIYANGITTGLNLLFTAVLSQRICPQYRLNLFMFDWKVVRELLSFGLQMQINNVGALICGHGDKIMIGFFLTMAKVTAYELGYRLALAARVVPMFLCTSLMPAAAEVHAKEDRKQLQRMFELGTRYLSLFVFPCMGLLMLSAPTLMAAWMKESRPESILAARCLSLGFMVNLLGGVGASMARGMGRPDIETRTIPLYLILNFGLGIPLILWLGFLGPLIATPVSTIAATVYVFYLFHSQLQLKVISFLRHGIAAPALGSLFACVVTGGVSRYVTCSVAAPRWHLCAYLVLQGLIFLGTYILFLWRFRLPTSEVRDWDLVKGGLRLVTASIDGTRPKFGFVRRVASE
jgi:O-antigen/teichoic acid export membrane protein